MEAIFCIRVQSKLETVLVFLAELNHKIFSQNRSVMLLFPDRDAILVHFMLSEQKIEAKKKKKKERQKQ